MMHFSFKTGQWLGGLDELLERVAGKKAESYFSKPLSPVLRKMVYKTFQSEGKYLLNTPWKPNTLYTTLVKTWRGQYNMKRYNEFMYKRKQKGYDKMPVGSSTKVLYDTGKMMRDLLNVTPNGNSVEVGTKRSYAIKHQSEDMKDRRSINTLPGTDTELSVQLARRQFIPETYEEIPKDVKKEMDKIINRLVDLNK